ncbi:MAG: zf-TFIIB domain-containing protein [Pyrinomonadaceae bacterium]
MKCPVCLKTELEARELEPDLFAAVCSDCNGKWISFASYEKWLEGLDGPLPNIDAEPASLTIPEFELARLCPECRRILVKYHVGKEVAFQIDRCGSCAGVWLDDNEWETLRSRNLHDDLNRVFTDHWQAEVARDETRKSLEQIYLKKFGDADYERIREFKDWVDAHEKKNEIISYVRDANPLQF